MLLEGIKFSVSGGDPLLFNLSSILIHLLNTCLVFCLTRLLFERRAVAVVVAALFAVHPLQVESIAWLSASMKTGLFAAFFLASLISYVIYVRRGTRTHFLFALGLFLLSCLSKEQAVMLSPTLIAID